MFNETAANIHRQNFPRIFLEHFPRPSSPFVQSSTKYQPEIAQRKSIVGSASRGANRVCGCRKKEGNLEEKAARWTKKVKRTVVETRGYLGEQACPATTQQCFRLVHSRVRQDLYFAVRKIYLRRATPGITSRNGLSSCFFAPHPPSRRVCREVESSFAPLWRLSQIIRVAPTRAKSTEDPLKQTVTNGFVFPALICVRLYVTFCTSHR